jgi:hypothetical protein
MLDIFNRQHPTPQASTMPAPQPMQGQAPMQPPARPVAGFMPAPQAPSGGMDVMQVMQTKPPGVDPQTWLAVCGPGMQGPAGGGNDRVGFRTANGDAGLQGANMPQPQRPSWLDGLGLTPMQGGMGFGGGAPQQGGPMQMPSAPFQSGMRAGSVGNQMGGLNNMYSNFAAPSPMPAPPPPMFGAPAGNSRAMMGPKPVGLF